ncbi:MAG: hypothetical protein ACREEM_43265 [Blastocatellia bacterium]
MYNKIAAQGSIASKIMQAIDWQSLIIVDNPFCEAFYRLVLQGQGDCTKIRNLKQASSSVPQQSVDRAVKSSSSAGITFGCDQRRGQGAERHENWLNREV